MIRIIEFQGRTINGEWVSGLLARKGDDWFISNKTYSPFAFHVDPDTIGQFTGMIDSKGTRVFEGCRLEIPTNPFLSSGVGTVAYYKDSFVFHFLDRDLPLCNKWGLEFILEQGAVVILS